MKNLKIKIQIYNVCNSCVSANTVCNFNFNTWLKRVSDQLFPIYFLKKIYTYMPLEEMG